MAPAFFSTLRRTKPVPAAMVRESSVSAVAWQLLSIARSAGAVPSSPRSSTTSSQRTWASDSAWFVVLFSAMCELSRTLSITYRQC